MPSSGQFDLIAVVDFSASAIPGPRRPTRDRCWFALADADGTRPPQYCRSRTDLLQHLGAAIAGTEGNVLVAWDFPFGYPASSGLGGGRAVARRFAALVEDDEPDRHNNRFQVADRLNHEMGGEVGPFWGYMGKEVLPSLRKGKPDFPVNGVEEHRIVERSIRDARGTPGFISSVWQLSYAGCVGGQAIMGLAVIERLHGNISGNRDVRYWPFDTNWDERLDGIVHVECWPSLFPFDHIDHPVRDAKQVAATLEVIVAANAAGDPGSLLGRPSGLSVEELRDVENCEGWIAGFRTGGRNA